MQTTTHPRAATLAEREPELRPAITPARIDALAQAVERLARELHAVEAEHADAIFAAGLADLAPVEATR